MSDLMEKILSDSSLAEFTKPDRVAGDLIDIEYGTATVLIHDSLRQQVGGVPLGCFLIAHRSNSIQNSANYIILLRVTGRARLPDFDNAAWARFEAGKRAIDSNQQWDDPSTTDEFTLNMLRHGGLTCRILGTFYSQSNQLFFGADIPNFYSGQGMKIYKPNDAALNTIVNYFKTEHSENGKDRVAIGRVRYSATEIEKDSISIEVKISPKDIVARRTALFGMSRTGKSNAVKIISNSIFQIGAGISDEAGHIGQLIFDIEGEYANPNPQDNTSFCSVSRQLQENRVCTYGMFRRDHDPNRKIMKIDFFGKDPTDWHDRDNILDALQTLIEGKSLIDNELQGERAGYVQAFVNANLEPPNVLDRSSSIRYRRVIQIYRAVLAEAGFSTPNDMQEVEIRGLFNEKLRQTINEDFPQVGNTLGKISISWNAAAAAFADLSKFLKSGTGKNFNKDYRNTSSSGQDWSDDTLNGILAIFDNTRGIRTLQNAREWHEPGEITDYVDDIVKDLRKGFLVIVDQSAGDQEMNEAAAERIVRRLFDAQKRSFIQNDNLPNVIVYAEEAHNLLPKSGSSDLRAIWPRIAKEGSKYHIGLVYATQEPSSILANILKNTDNWFLAHLNNSDETHELRKYYDFADFESQILQVPDQGFLRMRTLSNPYTIPVQIYQFGSEKK